MLVVKATVFSKQFLISYMVIPIITYSLDKLVFNTLAITLNILLKAILRIDGVYIQIICHCKVHGAMHCFYKQLQTVKM